MNQPDVNDNYADGLEPDETDDLVEGGALAFEVIAPPDADGARIDRVLARLLPDLSRTRIQRLVGEGRVRTGQRVVGDPADRVNGGDVLTVDVPPPAPAAPLPEPIALDVVHEDADLIVIDKPAGLVVHPAPGHWTGTLVNGLLHHCGASLSGIGGVRRPGIVHRLDKDTSGLLVVAKTDAAHRHLAAQFADHGRSGALRRTYVAVVWGVPASRGSLDAPIDRHPTNRQKMAVREGGRMAVTHWRLVEAIEDADGAPLASVVECSLETGRTHQIRVHMAHLGHPLLGDEVYGAGFRTKSRRLSSAARTALTALDRQALHAAHLSFVHPVSGAVMGFDSPLPADLKALRAALSAPF